MESITLTGQAICNFLYFRFFTSNTTYCVSNYLNYLVLASHPLQAVYIPLFFLKQFFQKCVPSP